MALSVVKMTGVEPEAILRPWHAKLWTITLDTSYPSGGYSVTNKTFALTNLYGLFVISGQVSGGYVIQYSRTSNTAGAVQAYWLPAESASPQALVAVTTGTNLSTVSFVAASIGQ